MKRIFILLIIASTSASGQILDWGADDDFSWWGDGNGTVGDFGLGYDSGTGKLTLKDTADNALLTGTDGGATLALSLTGSLTCSGTLSAAATAFEASANPVLTLTRTITGTTGGVIPLVIRGETSGDMTDGFEVLIDGEIQDNAAGPNVIARIRMGRDGADDQGDMSLQTATTGGTLTTGIHIDDDQNVTVPNGNLDITGTLTCDTSATVGSTTVSPDELGYIDGVTPGTLSNSKAIVVDSSGKINVMDITALTLNGTAVSATATEINRLAGVTPGTITASKVVEVDASNKVNEWTVTGSSDTETGFIGPQIGPSGDASLIGLSAGAVSIPDGVITVEDGIADGAAIYGIATATNGSGGDVIGVQGELAPTLASDSGSRRYAMRGLVRMPETGDTCGFGIGLKVLLYDADVDRQGSLTAYYGIRISDEPTGTYGSLAIYNGMLVDAISKGTLENSFCVVGDIGNDTATTHKGIVIGDIGGTASTTTRGIEIGDVEGAAGSTVYGFKCGDVSGGTDNYVIYTGTGVAHFGGTLDVDGATNFDSDATFADDGEGIVLTTTGAGSVSFKGSTGQPNEAELTGSLDVSGTTQTASLDVTSRMRTSNVANITADDTTPSVSAANIFRVPATWTAGHDITAFDSGLTGQTITVIGGDTDCNVIDGSNLKLSADWNADPDDTLVITYDGTSWYELSRSAN